MASSRPSVSIKVLKDTDDFAEISMSADLITMLMKYPRSENGKSDYTDSPVIKKAKQDLITKATHPTEMGLLTNASHKSVRKKKAKTNSISTCFSNETIHSTHFHSEEDALQSGKINPVIDISSKSIPDHMKLLDNTNSVKHRGIKDIQEVKTSMLNYQIYQLDTGSTGEKGSVRECSDASVYPVMSASSKTVTNAYSETLEFQEALIADDILTSFCAQKENNPVLLYTSDVSSLLGVHKKSMPVVLDGKALKSTKEPILKCKVTEDIFKPLQIDREGEKFSAKVQDFSKPQVDYIERGPFKPHMEHVNKETSLFNSATIQSAQMKCKSISQNTIAVSGSSKGHKTDSLVFSSNDRSQTSKSLRSKKDMERKSVNPPPQLELRESSTIDLKTSLEILGNYEQSSHSNSFTSLKKGGKNSNIHLSKTHKKRKHSICDEKNVWKSVTSHRKRKIVCSDDGDLNKEKSSFNAEKESIFKISQNGSISELPITNKRKNMDSKVKEISRPNRKRIEPVISISDDNSKSSFVDSKCDSVSSERKFKFNSIPQKHIKLTTSSGNDSHSSKSHNQNSSFVSDADSHFTLYEPCAKNIGHSTDSCSISSSNKEKKSVISKADSFKSSKNLNEKKQAFSKTSKSFKRHIESKQNAINVLDVSLSLESHEESKILSLEGDGNSTSFKAHRKRKNNSSCKEDKKDLSLCTADNFHSSSFHAESKNNAAKFDDPSSCKIKVTESNLISSKADNCVDHNVKESKKVASDAINDLHGLINHKRHFDLRNIGDSTSSLSDYKNIQVLSTDNYPSLKTPKKGKNCSPDADCTSWKGKVKPVQPNTYQSLKSHKTKKTGKSKSFTKIEHGSAKACVGLKLSKVHKDSKSVSFSSDMADGNYALSKVSTETIHVSSTTDNDVTSPSQSFKSSRSIPEKISESCKDLANINHVYSENINTNTLPYYEAKSCKPLQNSKLNYPDTSVMLSVDEENKHTILNTDSDSKLSKAHGKLNSMCSKSVSGTNNNSNEDSPQNGNKNFSLEVAENGTSVSKMKVHSLELNEKENIPKVPEISNMEMGNENSVSSYVDISNLDNETGGLVSNAEEIEDIELCSYRNDFEDKNIYHLETETESAISNFEEFLHQEYKKNKMLNVENISNTNVNSVSNAVEMYTLELTENCMTSGSDKMSHLVNTVNNSNVTNTEGSSNLEHTNNANIILNTENFESLESDEPLDMVPNAEDNSDCKSTENITIASNRKNISRLDTRENRKNVSNIEDNSSPTLNALHMSQYSVEPRSLQPPTQPEWITKPLAQDNPQCSYETDLKETLSSTLYFPPKTSHKHKEDLQIVSMKSDKERDLFTLDPSDIVKSFETQLEQLQKSTSVALKSSDSERFTETITSTVNSTPDNFSNFSLADKTSYCFKHIAGLSQPLKRQNSLAADIKSTRVLRPRKTKDGLSDVLTKSTPVPSNSSYLSFGHQENQPSDSYSSFNLLLSVVSKMSSTHKIEQKNNLENTFSNVKDSSGLSDSIPIALVGSTTLESNTPESDAVTALLSLGSVVEQDAIVPQNFQILTEQGNPLHDTDEDIIKSDNLNPLSSNSRGLLDRNGQNLLSNCPLLDNREHLVQESGSISRNSEAERTVINTDFRDDAYKTSENTFLTSISCAGPDKLNNIVNSVPLCFSNYQPSTPGDRLSLVESNSSDLGLLEKPRNHKRENVLIPGKTPQEINTLKLNTTMHSSSVNRHDLTQTATASNGLHQYSNVLPNLVKTHNVATQDDNIVTRKSSRMKIPNVIILSSSSSRSQESAHPGLIKGIGSCILQPEKVIVRHEGEKRSVIVLPCDVQSCDVSTKLTEILEKTTFIQPSINSDNVINVYDMSNGSTSLHVSEYCLETMNLCSHPNQKDVDDKTMKTLTGTNNDVTGVPVTPPMCIVPPYVVNSSADTPGSPDVELSEKVHGKSDRFTLLHPQVDSEMQQALLSRLVKQDQSYQERNRRQSHDLADITGEKSVKHWTYKEVESWFYANGLEKALPLIGDKNSKTLMELKTLQKSRPKEFFKKAAVYRDALPLEKLLQFSKILREMAADMEKCQTLEG